MSDDLKDLTMPEGAITFDGSAESLARAIELLLSVPGKHDFACRPSSGRCTAECIRRKNCRDIAEVAVLEYRRKLELKNPDPEGQELG
jgi:hypothetical protein